MFLLFDFHNSATTFYAVCRASSNTEKNFSFRKLFKDLIKVKNVYKLQKR